MLLVTKKPKKVLNGQRLGEKGKQVVYGGKLREKWHSNHLDFS